MSEFKVIETQEQLDSILKERIERAKKTAEENVRKEFADYESLKAEKDALAKKLEEANASVKGFDDKEKELKERIGNLETENRNYKISSLKIKVAQEAGLPIEMADRLNGEDEETIKADAETMAKFISSPQVAPFGSSEPIAESKDSFTAGLSRMVKNIDLSD